MSDEAQRQETLSPQDAWMAEQIVKAEQAEATVEDWRLYECSVAAD